MIRLRFVYELLDPRDYSVRYVGMSLNPYRRWSGHKNAANGRSQVYHPELSEWVRSLADLNLRPIISLVSVAHTDSDARKKESARIEERKAQGASIFNRFNRNRQKKNGQ